MTEKILIETYRGFPIEFNISAEEFRCVCSEEKTKQSHSFSAIKKYIDEYLKTNEGFQPFFVDAIPSMYGTCEKLKITGIRKDGRFIAEDENGKKMQIADWQFSDYMLSQKENEVLLKELASLEEEYQKQLQKHRDNRKLIIAQLNVVTLKDYRAELESNLPSHD